MSPGLARSAAKARHAPTRPCTSLAPHLAGERVWHQLWHVPRPTAPGRDGQTVDDLTQDVAAWSATTRRALPTQGDRPPPGRRPDIPQPGPRELRPLGGPCLGARVLPRRVAAVLAALSEQDFLPCSFGGRPGGGAHHALATVHAVRAGKPGSWLSEADLRHCLGSVDPAWLWRFVPHRRGAPRLVCWIRRGLTAGGREAGSIEPSAEGGPQGGSLSVVRSTLSLHAVLERWCERVVRPRVHGEASRMRSREDCVGCCQYRAAAQRCEQGLGQRLATGALALEPTKPRLVAFGRCAERDAKRDGKRRETCPLLGFPLDCTRNRQGNCTVGGRSDKSRLRRRLATCHQLLQSMRHAPLTEQAEQSTQGLRGHDAYAGVAGHVGSLLGVYRHGERYGRTMRSRRSHKGYVRWQALVAIKRSDPLPRPKRSLP